MNIDTKFFIKIFANQIQDHIKIDLSYSKLLKDGSLFKRFLWSQCTISVDVKLPEPRLGPQSVAI